MNPGTPFLRGSLISPSWLGVGANPINPSPLRASRSAELTTVRKEISWMHFESSLLKQALSWAGCPTILPFPYWRAYPAFSFSLNSLDWVWWNLPFFAGHLSFPHFSENNQAHADPVSNMTCISYDGFPNQNLPSYPIFFRLSRSIVIGEPNVLEWEWPLPIDFEDYFLSIVFWIRLM